VEERALVPDPIKELLLRFEDLGERSGVLLEVGHVEDLLEVLAVVVGERARSTRVAAPEHAPTPARSE
jgi:hypothetical protein